MSAIKKTERLTSLDAFRGLAIAGMILVNNPGSWAHIYDPLEHAEWHGWTPTDLIFPFFLFIVGVAMTFSLSKLRRHNVSKVEIYKKVLRRTLILFGLGLFLNAFPFVQFESLRAIDYSSLRIMGVLQRIALCYLFASIIMLEFRKPLWHGAWAFGLIIFYWIVMFTIPVPGHGAGDLSMEGNLAAYLDQLILPNHLWKPGWDPEGLLSTIPATGTVLFGILTGHLLHKGWSNGQKFLAMAIAGILGIISGYVVNIWFPINKGLWSTSYVLFTAGMALLILALFYWLIDMKGIKKWAKPLVVYGMNAITVFVLAGLLSRLLTLIKIPVSGGSISVKGYIYHHLLTPIASPVDASLIYAVIYVIFWLGMMWMLYRRKVFIKI
ncbi:MAG: DUF5009 domain-containing protein [Candidatus Marinimicrobia bacterium]|nr:DUF5009 domain-containing protein [Candidatus Neomarinimicrobiota bacterium]MCF7830027.1 DUF5009 domain-containing protein [Candidatus Neomarinimicrobiota bacterium]MCF7881931.1 DUF5009 domain-containing protein [Candidatus Neomarinimicrobiota bacterium]